MEAWEYRQDQVLLASGFHATAGGTDFSGGIPEVVNRWVNPLGREGWELVSVVPIVGTENLETTTIGMQLWFKRPLPA
jgi:hypothetical protein